MDGLESTQGNGENKDGSETDKSCILDDGDSNNKVKVAGDGDEIADDDESGGREDESENILESGGNSNTEGAMELHRSTRI